MRLGWWAESGSRRAAAGNEEPPYRLKTAVGTVLASIFAVLTLAAPAQAGTGDESDALRLGGGKLNGPGTEVHVRVSYQCQEGQTAGVGIFLTQAYRHVPAVFGGAGSGQRPCTGETEHVTLTIHAGSDKFSPGRASATVSIIISGPGISNEIQEVTDDIRLDRS